MAKDFKDSKFTIEDPIKGIEYRLGRERKREREKKMG